MTSPYRTFFLLGAALLAALTLSLRFLAHWPWLWSYLVGVSLATSVLYAHDKLAARAQWLRVPERVLHAFALVGGSPGALVAQHIFRHKMSKRSFQAVFWVIAVLQALLLLAFLFVPALRDASGT